MTYRENCNPAAAILVSIGSGSIIILEQERITLLKACLVLKVLKRYIPDHLLIIAFVDDDEIE